MLAGSAAIFLGVGLILALAHGRKTKRVLSTRWLLLGGGLVMPSLVLIALVFAALLLGERLLAAPAQQSIRIQAVARQWQWEFRYPDNGGTGRTLAASPTLFIPAGQVVEFEVTSEDVIHSFWIPRLGGKIDAIPGHTNIVRLRADQPGYYGGVCAEFCGNGHAVMRFAVQAYEPERFEAVMRDLSARQTEQP